MIGSATMFGGRRLPALAIALVLAALVCDPVSARPVVAEDLYRIATVGNPRISPDGAWVAYTVSTPHREEDKDNKDLWLVSWDGRKRLQLTSTPASEHTPRWSPDGGRLAFLSDRADSESGDQI